MKREIELALALVWGLVVAVALYGAIRAVQFVLFPEPNPALVVWSAHAGYLWRVWIVAYAGGGASFVAYMLARRDSARVARALVPALTVSAVMLALQGVLLP